MSEVIALHAKKARSDCSVRGLMKGDCPHRQALLADGTHSEFCYYHHKMHAGLLSPLIEDSYVGTRLQSLPLMVRVV